MTKSIKVACVGAGYLSKFHYESWARMDDVQVVGSCNRDISKAQATGYAAYDDLSKMLSDTNPDLLDVILPPVAHAQTIKTAIAQGVKTIICQKPFCQDIQEAKSMIALADEAGTRIVVHENFRFQPWYRQIKKALSENAIGEVQQLTFRLRPGDGQGMDAYLDRQPYFREMKRFLIHETAVHWVDTFRFLLGEPTAVYADLRKVNPVIAGEDAGYVIFDHPNGVRAIFDGNRNLDHAADNLRRTMGEALIEGSKGSLALRGDGSISLRKFAQTEEAEILAADTWDGFGGDCVHHLQSHVISGLIHGSDIENEAKDYIRVIEIENAIYSSAETGQKTALD